MTRERSCERLAQDFSGESVTQTHLRDMVDVNTIVRHYHKTGFLPPAQTAQTFGFASAKTYEESMRDVAEVQSAFAELPAEQRQAHGNDPGRWIDSLMAEATTPDEIVAPEASEAVSASPPEGSTETSENPPSDIT